MNAIEIRNALHQRMTAIASYQQDAKQLAAMRRSHLKRLLVKEAQADIQESETLTRINMIYRDPLSGEYTSYGRVRRNVKDEILNLDLHENKQYQWLLAEAYEEFEDFLEMMYANAGLHDRSFWPLAHYGNISLDELEHKDWNWHLYQVRRPESRISAEIILRQFRRKLPAFANAEQDNALELNLRFDVALIAQLRHHIVHTAGKVSEREDFSKKILDGIGRWNNGKPSDYRDEIDSLFFEPPHEKIIALLDIQMGDKATWPSFMDVMQNLCRRLLCSAHLLTHFLVKHQNGLDTGSIEIEKTAE